MTPDEIARSKAREALLNDSSLGSLVSTSCLHTLYVQYVTALPTRGRGIIYCHELAPGLYLAEECYDVGHGDDQEEELSYHLVVNDPVKLGIRVEDLDEYSQKKFAKAAT